MIAIIMAGGFAKRLGYPDKSKCLIEIGNKPIIDYTIDKLKEIPEINEIIIITSEPFLEMFLDWSKNKEKIRVVSDGGKSQEEKVGVLTALLNFLDKEVINEDIFWAGADNFFHFSLKTPTEIFKNKKKDLAIFYDIKNYEDAKRFGVILTDKNNTITSFEEKPENPKSTIISACMYFIKKDSIKLLKELRNHEHSKDNMGIVIEHLHKKVNVLAHIAEEGNIDIGSIEALNNAKEKLESENSRFNI